MGMYNFFFSSCKLLLSRFNSASRFFKMLMLSLTSWAMSAIGLDNWCMILRASLIAAVWCTKCGGKLIIYSIILITGRNISSYYKTLLIYKIKTYFQHSFIEWFQLSILHCRSLLLSFTPLFIATKLLNASLSKQKAFRSKGISAWAGFCRISSVIFLNNCKVSPAL